MGRWEKGVDEGVALNGMPLEIMGLLFGHPADDGKTVEDAFEAADSAMAALPGSAVHTRSGW